MNASATARRPCFCIGNTVKYYDRNVNYFTIFRKDSLLNSVRAVGMITKVTGDERKQIPAQYKFSLSNISISLLNLSIIFQFIIYDHFCFFIIQI
jgi:hypothetical protein